MNSAERYPRQIGDQHWQDVQGLRSLDARFIYVIGLEYENLLSAIDLVSQAFDEGVSKSESVTGDSVETQSG